MNEYHLSDTTFNSLRKLIKSQSGIHLADHKKTLVMSRTFKTLSDLQLTSYEDYLTYLKDDPHNHRMADLLERITTNHTYFHREQEHFNFLKTMILPDLIDRQGLKDIRIWSAGCATGEEPYSISMSLHDYLETRWQEVDVKVLATDISKEVLLKAQKGHYLPERLEGVSKIEKQRYFISQGDHFEVKPFLRENVLFRQVNLMDTFPFKRKVHVIFCRNVMIYFDKATKARLIDKFYDQLEEGGYLIIGHSETLDRLATPLKYIQPSIYRK